MSRPDHPSPSHTPWTPPLDQYGWWTKLSNTMVRSSLRVRFSEMGFSGRLAKELQLIIKITNTLTERYLVKSNCLPTFQYVNMILYGRLDAAGIPESFCKSRWTLVRTIRLVTPSPLSRPPPAPPAKIYSKSAGPSVEQPRGCEGLPLSSILLPLLFRIRILFFRMRLALPSPSTCWRGWGCGHEGGLECKWQWESRCNYI